MAVAKEQGREKPVKIEQRRGPQAEQTALLASPIYIGRPWGGKNIKRGAKIRPGTSLCVFWVGPPSHLKDLFSFAF